MLIARLLTLGAKCQIAGCHGRRVILQSTKYKHFISQQLFSTCKVLNRLQDDKVVEVDDKKSNKLPKISEYKRLLSLAHAERMKIGAAVGFLTISSTVSLSVPFAMGKIIDIINTAAQHGDLTNQLNTICSVLFVVFATGGFANFCRIYLMDIAGIRIVKQLRENLFSSLMKQEVGFFDKTKTGELINRLSSDATLIGNTVTFNISDGLRALAQAIGSCGMMLYVSPKLTLVALCIVPPVAIMARYFGQYMKRLTREIQDQQAEATAIAEEKLSNIRTVRSFAKEEMEVGKYRDSLSKVIGVQKKQALTEGVFYGMTGFSGNMIVLTVFYAGGMMMSESLLTIGELSAFLLYAAYIGISISGLTSFYSELMRGLGASSRIWELIDRKPEVPAIGGLKPEGHLSGNIEFQDVSFTYPSRPDAHILNHLNLVMPTGTVTAVVGASGSGKSTVGGLLLRFYDPNNGNILIDGQDVKSLDPNWLRNQIGVVSQEPALFSCSVADNIRYGAVDPSSVTMEMVEEAARQANAYMFIQAFPQQFDTVVGESGKMLSGGQKQRIALARAILKNPRILLLDEATSALDAESEYLVQEALDRLMVGRTVITIAHRLSTIKSADQIAVLDSGKVLELGSYSDLISIENGIFRKLVERQTITT